MQYFHTDSRFAPITTLGQTVSVPEWETAAERLEGRVIHENARSLIIGRDHRIADCPIRDG
jgi:hypothetical protein